MIRLYCRRKEHNAELCEACRSLLSYACRRLETCRYGPLKGSCKQCKIHCYAPAQREKIQAVMRYAGPRMLLYHPGRPVQRCDKFIVQGSGTKKPV